MNLFLFLNLVIISAKRCHRADDDQDNLYLGTTVHPSEDYYQDTPLHMVSVSLSKPNAKAGHFNVPHFYSNFFNVLK
jgi:hypothetical protein